MVALHIGLGGQLDQVLVADVVLRHEDGVVVELLAATGIATGVIGSASPTRTLVAAFVRKVDLGADDRLDALILAAPVEVEDAVHVAVVGDRHSGLAVGDRSGNGLVESRPPSSIEYSVWTCR